VRSIAATVQDFRITLATGSVPAGRTTFVLHSRGPSTHEFVIARTDIMADRLPLGADGLTVDEESKQLSDVDRLAFLDLGETITLTVSLPPGRYVIFCNFEGHYLGGMHAALEVDASQA
jgi:uncharacterized cupredoxin-like copper-binding protein